MSIVMETAGEELAAPHRLRALRPALFRTDGEGVGYDAPHSLLEMPTGSEELSRELRHARELAHRHPSSSTAWARLAQAELVEQRSDEAADAARAALSASAGSSDTAAQFAAALTLVHVEERDDAEAALAKMGWGAGPIAVLAASLAAQRGDLAAASERLAGETSAAAWALHGWIALHQRCYPAAVKAYRQAIRLMGPTPELLTNMGFAHAALGELDRAVRNTQHALALQPSRRERVVFNLATYLVSSGEGEAAIEVVDRLNRDAPTAETAFVHARLHLALGDPERAHRVLRRARTQMWAHLDRDSRAELDANLASVRGHLGQLDRHEVAGKLVDALERTEYESVRIASLLPHVLTRFSDVGLLRTVVARLREQHPEHPLLELEPYLAILERRFDDAVAAAVEWSRQAVLDPEPAALAVYLVCDLEQDYERAVKIGADALQRMPAAHRLRHNLGYALALSGAPSEARGYVFDGGDEVPAIATRALLMLQEGDTAGAVAEYRRALRVAENMPDPSLPVLVDLHARFALERIAAEPSAWQGLDQDAYADLLDDPRVAIAVEMLRRTQIALPAYLG